MQLSARDVVGELYGYREAIAPSQLRYACSVADEAETETDVDEPDALPTPLRVARFPMVSPSLDHVVLGFTSPHAGGKRATPFVPRGDVPKKRLHSSNFNYIRSGNVQNKESDSDKEEKPNVVRSKRDFVACADCRKRRRKCKHGNMQVSKAPEKKASAVRRRTKLKSEEPQEPDVKPLKKDGTPYTRVPHDHSKGPSMTPSAVDYRERKVIQQQYYGRLADLLDADIVDQVEAEGGITPEGRLYKAAVRMMERVTEERAVREAMISHDAMVTRIPEDQQYLVAQNNELQMSLNSAVLELTDFKERLRALLNDAI